MLCKITNGHYRAPFFNTYTYSDQTNEIKANRVTVSVTNEKTYAITLIALKPLATWINDS